MKKMTYIYTQRGAPIKTTKQLYIIYIYAIPDGDCDGTVDGNCDGTPVGDPCKKNQQTHTHTHTIKIINFSNTATKTQ